MFEDQFYNRLSQLRMEKGVSARDMSLSIGQCDSYINRIENRKMLPSLSSFFYICDYFDMTPAEFFSGGEINDIDLINAMKKISDLPQDKREHILAVINDL